MEGAARGVHLLPLVDPLELPLGSVEGALLQRPHLDCEPGAQLLQCRSLHRRPGGGPQADRRQKGEVDLILDS